MLIITLNQWRNILRTLFPILPNRRTKSARQALHFHQPYILLRVWLEICQDENPHSGKRKIGNSHFFNPNWADR